VRAGRSAAHPSIGRPAALSCYPNFVLRWRSCKVVSSAGRHEAIVLLDEAIFPAHEDRLKPTPDNNNY
jgi:hypothetical protein